MEDDWSWVVLTESPKISTSVADDDPDELELLQAKVRWACRFDLMDMIFRQSNLWISFI